MRSGSKRTIAGVVAGVAVLAGSGAALAHGGPGMPFGLGGGGNNQTALLNDVAKNLNVSNTALRKAVKDALKARVDQQVKDGLLTKAQGDDIKARIDSGAVHVGVGPAGLGGGLGAIEAASSYLGLTAAEIRTQLAAGKSLADIAKDRGKTSAGLQDAIVAQATAQLAAAVAAGDLTDAQRDTILTRVKDTVDELVAQVRGPLGLGGHLGQGPGSMGARGFMPARALRHR
jgi:hypothetical protein